MIARLQPEKSFFATGDAVQELVRGTIEAYWHWSLPGSTPGPGHQQVEQGQEAFNRAEGALLVGMGRGDRGPIPVGPGQFPRGLITAQGMVLPREDVLRNLIGLPPFNGTVRCRSPPPRRSGLKTNWPEILSLAPSGVRT